jgi:regulatory protein
MTDNEIKIINDVLTRLLAMREQSRHELLNKLLLRGFDAEISLRQLDKFTEALVQSDKRFAESLVRSRAAKGKGPQYIRMELREHRIADELAAQAIAEQEIDWFALARQVMVKKYGASTAPDWQQQQKRSRFLQYRGFTSDQIKFAHDSSK